MRMRRLLRHAAALQQALEEEQRLRLEAEEAAAAVESQPRAIPSGRIADEVRDVLTGLLNRSQFRSQVRSAARTSTHYAVVLVDIDAFREINESYGHMVGDAHQSSRPNQLDPLEPGVRVPLDPDLLAQFPEGYRHLAYLQTRIGYEVKRDMPGLTGPEVEELYRRGARWLAGE